MNTIHRFIRRPSLFVLLGLIVCIPAAPTAALQYGSGLYGTCTYGSCSISIGTSGSVALNITPTASGKCTTQSDVVTVATDNATGFTLTLANTSTNTSLVNGAATITAGSGSQAAPQALTSNKWGYRVDGVGGFGAGPTSAQSSANLSGILFAGVPASNAAPSVIANTAESAEPPVPTTIWYSSCANTSITSGSYSTEVTYSAVVN